jgi:hypothetical protein
LRALTRRETSLAERQSSFIVFARLYIFTAKHPPAGANTGAVALLMALEPPVTTATLLVNLFISEAPFGVAQSKGQRLEATSVKQGSV